MSKRFEIAKLPFSITPSFFRIPKPLARSRSVVFLQAR
jgi:hypothetical protein